MLRKINRNLRKVLVITAAVVLVMKLTEEKSENRNSRHGYQTEEFDDIW